MKLELSRTPIIGKLTCFDTLNIAKPSLLYCPLSGLRCYAGEVQFSRISTNPDVMGGKPCIRGMRVTVGMIVEAIAVGRSTDDLLRDFPYLEAEDIREALAFAASLAQGRESPLAG